jgi:hypothetical protein
MSQPGANARHRHRRRSAPPGSRVKRPLLAISVLLLVLAPISWILVQQPNSGEADASIPYVTGGDDRYVTTSNEPVAATSFPVPSPSQTPTPNDTTGTPTQRPTPGKTPTQRPTAGPTGVPTDGPTVTPTDEPTRAGTTLTPTPSKTAGSKPTSTPTTSTPPPPADDGNMSPEELQLFTLIDNARTTDKGCAPLQRNSGLSGSAQSDADQRAKSNNFSAGGSSAAAGGNNMNAGDAFNQMMKQSSGTLLNCGLNELGVGRGTYKSCFILFCSTRVGWVADFQ